MRFIATLTLSLMMIVSLSAEVNVTFRANTAFVPDTLNANSTVQMRGALPTLTWDNTSPVVFTNVGGDYWEATMSVPDGTVGEYKFFTNSLPAPIDAAWGGWEGDPNRSLDLSAFTGTDTTLPLQYVNGYMNGAPQYDAPFETNDSTFAIHIRVNIQGYEDFNDETMWVGARGSNMGDWSQAGEMDWGKTFFLTQESPHANGGSQQYNAANFYSGTLHMPNTYANAGVAVKFVIHNADADPTEDWGNMVAEASYQNETSTTGADTTLYWEWFNGMVPAGFTGADTTDLTFKADFSTTINENGYQVGDSVIVRYGYFGSAMEVGVAGLTKEGLFGNVYSVTIPDVVLSFGENLYYQYYKLDDEGAEYREVYFNFDYEGDTPSEAERREVLIEGVDAMVMDDVISTVDARRQPLFRNTNSVGGHVTVSYTLDMRPAYWHVERGVVLDDIQGNFDIATTAQIDEMGAFMNGPATGGWTGWGLPLAELEEKQLFDDATHGDLVAGDSVYTLQIEYAPDSTNNVIGQEFKFGIGGGDNESSYGLNHIENINDAQDTYTIASAWGSINPNFYHMWNYDANMGYVAIDEVVAPEALSLSQNYPNPFNPTTSINYVLPEATSVELTVFNALGQEVRTLKAGHYNAGSYSVNWDGLDNTGNMISSGLYIYTLTAGDQSISKKMLMLK